MHEINPKDIEKYVKVSQRRRFRNGENATPINSFVTNAVLSFFDKNKDGRISIPEFQSISKEDYSIFAKELKEYNKTNGIDDTVFSYEELGSYLDDGYIDERDLEGDNPKYLDRRLVLKEQKGQKHIALMTQEEIDEEFNKYGVDNTANPNIINSLRKERNEIDENSDIIDWHIGTANQGKLETCTVLAYAESLSDEELHNLYSKKTDKDGNIYYEFNFPSDNGKKPVKVTQKELDNMSIKTGKKEITGFSTGDKDTMLIEMAYLKRYGTKIIKEGAQPTDIISKFNNNKANFYSDITEKLLSSDAPKILSLLDVSVLEKEKGVKSDEINLNSGKTASIRINENPLRADLQTELKLPDGSVIYGNHAYSVKGYNPDTKEVTITNPYENSTDIIIPFEIIKLFGIAM